MVDKNLFLYDLAIAAIMKNEEPYVKEWLDYHLLAGVDHFYIYDNDSTPEFKNILQPYIDAGIVTYIHFPGKIRQMEAYNDAVQRFKFQCRYMAFIDGDEFIFPKSKSTITEILDEVLSSNPNAAALGVQWYLFGSNGQEKADYSRGVLERFTRRLPEVNEHIKSISNPRCVEFCCQPHFPVHFNGTYMLNENGLPYHLSAPPFSGNKIIINHYAVKSKEEYAKKIARGYPDANPHLTEKALENFEQDQLKYTEFDDDILKYREARYNALIPQGGGIDNLFQHKKINDRRLIDALIQNLFHTTLQGSSPQFFTGKMKNFLTCLNLTLYLKEKFLDETSAKFFEEASLKAIQNALYAGELTTTDIMLLIDEMPKILQMDYPAVKNIRDVLLSIIPQLMETFRAFQQPLFWKNFVNLKYILELLRIFKI